MKMTLEQFEAWAEKHNVSTNLHAGIHPWSSERSDEIFLTLYVQGDCKQALFWSTPQLDHPDMVATYNIETGERLK